MFGSDHPDVAASFNNIGAVYAGKGDFETALVQFQKALEIRTRVFGSDHPDVATSYNNIGNVYIKKKTNRWQEGLLRAERSMLFPKN